MNRLFGVTGLLAAGTVAFLVWFILALPWMPLFRSPNASATAWGIWAAVSATGLALVVGFVFRSLAAHWAALRHNAPIPPAAWRGVCGIYLLLALAFVAPVLAADPSGTHLVERWIYGGLAAMALALSIASARGGWGCTRDKAPGGSLPAL